MQAALSATSATSVDEPAMVAAPAALCRMARFGVNSATFDAMEFALMDGC